MDLLRLLGRSVWHIALSVVSLAVVLLVWFNHAPLVVWLIDQNLRLIKWGSGLIPEPYGSMVEIALRTGLGADKMLLFAEVGLFVRVLLHFGRRLFPKAKKSQKKKN